jgi:hypothetical protein
LPRPNQVRRHLIHNDPRQLLLIWNHKRHHLGPIDLTRPMDILKRLRMPLQRICGNNTH